MAPTIIRTPQTLPDAVDSLRRYLHPWPGLEVLAGDNKIIITMERKLSIYTPKNWRGWPVELVVQK